ncbi:response regulator transcription factor [Streptomyces platensis]|uniref:response regulator transcription factor n=1 Tax=Streptomyces platensis TaxID=58346 RepID=UPI002E0F9C63|nr:response regulator transcription factor [Streptomyces platensis]WTI50711.1 response regulator transcription factor [Streptomyces platensis]
MIRLLVVDDDPLVRSGLRLLFAGADGIDVVAEAADGTEVQPLVRAFTPDVVLMDIRMPVMDGLAATRLLRSRPPAPEVVMLTTFHSDEYVVRALRAGAAGFLLKDTPPREMVEAVRKVAAGDPVLSPSVIHQLITAVTVESDADERRRAARERLAVLGDRERAVAVAVSRGLTNVEAAAELFISVPTVKTHVSSILTKLGLNNRVQIALLIHDADDR